MRGLALSAQVEKLKSNLLSHRNDLHLKLEQIAVVPQTLLKSTRKSSQTQGLSGEEIIEQKPQAETSQGPASPWRSLTSLVKRRGSVAMKRIDQISNTKAAVEAARQYHKQIADQEILDHEAIPHSHIAEISRVKHLFDCENRSEWLDCVALVRKALDDNHIDHSDIDLSWTMTNATHLRSFVKDQVVIEQGKPYRRLFLLLHGAVALYHHDVETGKTVQRDQTLYPGQVFGCTSRNQIVMRIPVTCTAISKDGPADVLEIGLHLTAAHAKWKNVRFPQWDSFEFFKDIAPRRQKALSKLVKPVENSPNIELIPKESLRPLFLFETGDIVVCQTTTSFERRAGAYPIVRYSSPEIICSAGFLESQPSSRRYVSSTRCVGHSLAKSDLVNVLSVEALARLRAYLQKRERQLIVHETRAERLADISLEYIGEIRNLGNTPKNLRSVKLQQVANATTNTLKAIHPTTATSASDTSYLHSERGSAPAVDEPEDYWKEEYTKMQEKEKEVPIFINSPRQGWSNSSISADKGVYHTCLIPYLITALPDETSASSKSPIFISDILTADPHRQERERRKYDLEKCNKLVKLCSSMSEQAKFQQCRRNGQWIWIKKSTQRIASSRGSCSIPTSSRATQLRLIPERASTSVRSQRIKKVQTISSQKKRLNINLVNISVSRQKNKCPGQQNPGSVLL